MMLNLPILIKEKDLLDRKDTINTFRHKAEFELFYELDKKNSVKG